MNQTSNTLVVGAGLAGLVVAYRLQQAGIAVDVIEARDRLGGRICSVPQALGTDLTAELGGEVFDTDHVACLTLAQSLALPLVDLRQQSPAHLVDTYWFGGVSLNPADLQAEFTALLQDQASHWQAVRQFIRQPVRTEVIHQLDGQSIPEYLAAVGASAQLIQAVATAYTIKYGVDAAAQSSLNLLCFFRCQQDCEHLFGFSDERYYLQGGNSQLIQALGNTLTAPVQLGTVLEALGEAAAGGYWVTLRQGQTRSDRHYHRVVLTLPFSVLRQLPLRVDLPAQKRQAIQTLGYNSPTKLISAYTHKPWQTHGCNGLVYTDYPFQHCWEASDSLRSAQEALLVAYPGGQAGRAIAQANPTAATQTTLQALEGIFPGLTQARKTPESLRSHWLSDPYSQGAYAAYTVGQWSALYGCEGERVGNLFFAGEHCSRIYQGYMEGACETAERVVLEILQDLKVTTAAHRQRSRLHHQATLRQTGFALSSPATAVEF